MRGKSTINLQSCDKIPIPQQQMGCSSSKLITTTSMSIIATLPLQSLSTSSVSSSGCIITTANTLPLTTAAAAAAATSASASTSSTSPLKIESVVPVRSRNINKSIHRSFSTLGSGYVHRPYDKFLNNNNTTDITKQKNVQNSNDLNNNNIITTTTTTTNNGFWRIQRTQKEKEKLPDRINMDRRGLTALPIIEDEPNLRLLSLQHNLINSFYVPEVVQQKQSQQSSQQLSIVMTNNNNNNNGNSGSQTNPSIATTNESLINGKKVINTIQKNHNTKRQQQTIQKSLSSRNLYHSTNNKSIISSNMVGGGNTININSSSSSSSSSSSTSTSSTSASLLKTQSNQNIIMTKNALAQKSILLNNTRGKYILRKSNSFINNYTHHTMTTTVAAASKLHLNRLLIQNQRVNQSLADVVGKHENEFNKSITSNMNGIIQQSMTMPTSTSINQLDELIIRNDNYNLGFADSLQNLVFLDLYDNQIEKIANLDGLKSLTVLLLGKNRIIDIGGIVSVKNTLRVLDLHGNRITNITNKINQLQELKSLNLAGNNLKQINADDFKGLFNLKELNVKRNKIKRIIGFDDLRNLERLWLCHNDLQKVDDMSSVAKALNLREITIENNPVSLAGDCVSFLVSYLPNLVLLSQMHVTEQVRRAAMAWRKNKELSDLNYSHLSNNLNYNIRREEVISNARTNWELLRAQQQQQQHHEHHSNHSHSHSHQHQQQNKMINITNQIQKSSRNSAQNQQSPIQNETIDPDVLSNLSDNIHIDKKLIRQKTVVINNNNNNGSINQKITKRMNLKMNRSSSQDNNHHHQSITTSNTNAQTPLLISSSTDDLFRLPPILAPFLDVIKQNETTTATATTTTTTTSASSSNDIELFNNNNNIERLTDGYSSGSSLGPNIDSSSSYIGSDTDEPDQKSSTTTTNKMENVKANNTMNDSTIEISNIEILNKLENEMNNEKSKTDENLKTIECLEYDNQSDNKNINSNKVITVDESSCNLDAGDGQTNIITSNDQILNNNNNVINSNKSVNTSNNNNNNNSTKCKMPNRKHSERTLIRAQTAKNSQTLIRQQSIQGALSSSTSSSSASSSSTSSTPSSNNVNGQTNNVTKTNQKIISNATIGTVQSNSSGSVINGSTITNPISMTTVTTTQSIPHNNTTNNNNNNEREREQGGDYLIEICGRYLNVYGTGAIKFIDRQWNAQKSADVHTIKFNYVNFNNIIIVLNRIKIRFPNAENLIFRETNIQCMGQLNALAEVQGLHSLVIDPEGNLICQKNNWRLYAIYRLSHWGLKQINGSDITEAEIQLAQRTYAGLSDLVLWSLPDSLLEPLIGRLRLDESYSASKQTPKQWLMQLDPSLKHVVGKEALQCKKSTVIQCSIYHNQNQTLNYHHHNTNTNHSQHQQHADEQLLLRQKGKTYFTVMMENTCNAVEKLQKLEILWPNLLIEMIRNTLLDYSQIDGYVKNLLSEMLKQ